MGIKHIPRTMEWLNERRQMTFTRVLVVAVALFGFSTGLVMAQSIGERSATEGDHGSSQLNGQYLTWLNLDVRWIISPEERSAYMALPSNVERSQFIKEFWQRRNTDPTNPENKFKEEHYRRIAYSNTHFAATNLGQMTDRGHMYIVHGAPDSIDAYPSGERGDTRPAEVWHYHMLDLKFVDTCECGDYPLAPSKF